MLIGRYAFGYELGDRYDNLTQAVQASADLLPEKIVLPHPSPRNNRWLARNPWFTKVVVPVLQARVAAILNI